jgi:hypothetical protein
VAPSLRLWRRRLGKNVESGVESRISFEIIISKPTDAADVGCTSHHMKFRLTKQTSMNSHVAALTPAANRVSEAGVAGSQRNKHS